MELPSLSLVGNKLPTGVFGILQSMDKVDLGDKKTFAIEKTESVTERLDATPQHSVSFPGGKVIDFGNTGFRINFFASRFNFDFAPENIEKPYVKNDVKHATMLGVAFLRLHNFLNNPTELSELGIEDSDINSISHKTNDELIKSVTRLFSRSNAHWLATTYGDVIKINLRGFRDLKNDDPLIQFLTRVSDRAKDTTVTYDKPIG